VSRLTETFARRAVSRDDHMRAGRASYEAYGRRALGEWERAPDARPGYREESGGAVRAFFGA
jgi:hypothetical protein